MAFDVAEISVDLTMDTGFAMQAAKEFGGVFDEMSLRVIREARQIDEVMRRVEGPDKATAEMIRLAAETDRSSAKIQRETKQIERSGETLVRQLERQNATYGMTTAEIKRMDVASKALAAEQRGMIELAGRLRAEQARLDAQMVRVTGTSGSMKSGMQQLSFQVNDMATMFAMGAKPMQIFASQAGQVIGAVQLMAGEAKGLIGFLGGPWGMVLTTAAVVAAPFVAKLFESGDASDAATGALGKHAQAAATLEDRIRDLNEVLGKNILTQQQQQIVSLNSATANLREAETVREKVRAQLALARVQLETDKTRSRAIGDRGDMAALSLPGGFAGVEAAERRLGEIEKRVAEGARAVRSGMVPLMQAQVTEAIDANAKANAAYERALGRLNVQFQAGAIDQAEYRRELEIATRARDYATAADDRARDARKLHNQSLRDATKAHREVEKAAREAAQAQAELERTLGGLVGRFDPARKAELDYVAALDDIARVQKAGMLSAAEATDFALKASAAYRAELEKLVQVMDLMGKPIDINVSLRRSMDELDKQIENGKPALDAALRGPIGASDALERVMQSGLRDLSRTMLSLSQGIGEMFGANSPIARQLGNLAQGAGIGASVAGAIGGSKFGGAIGGAIGGELGKKFLTEGLTQISSQLGTFAGPLGSIAGGLIGSFATGLLKSTKKASATIGAINDELAIMSVTGNSGKRMAASEAAAGSLLDALGQIANRLGGDLGSAGNVSIGIRKKDYRVDPTGAGRTKGAGVVDFGEDQQAAFEFALRNLIADGAITGLREATSRLVKDGSDLERQLQKAIDFEGVFSSLKQATDPTAYAVEELDKQFKQLRATFTEASASIAETADLERLYQIRREAIERQAEQQNADRRRLEAALLDAQGDAAGAMAINRQVELAGMDAGLRMLQQQVWAAQDAQEAASAAKELGEAWKGVSASLMDEVRRIRGLTDAGTPAGFATLQGRFNATANAALGGDIEAARNLPQLSKALLDAAAEAATSRQELDRVQGQTASMLEMIAAQAGGGGTAADPVEAAATATAAQTTATANSTAELVIEVRALRAEVAQLRSDSNSGMAQVAGNTGRTARVLENVSGPYGGDAIAIANGR